MGAVMVVVMLLDIIVDHQVIVIHLMIIMVVEVDLMDMNTEEVGMVMKSLLHQQKCKCVEYLFVYLLNKLKIFLRLYNAWVRLIITISYHLFLINFKIKIFLKFLILVF